MHSQVAAHAFDIAEAEAALTLLAGGIRRIAIPGEDAAKRSGVSFEAAYKTLLDQIPAVVFLAFMDGGTGQAYVSPQIEAALGFSQAEWLEDPIRWFQQIHPEDQKRWSAEAASLFVTGEPLRSSYRVMARDGHVVWFQCEARLVYHDDGTPWFIHGVGFDISELKNGEQALREERNFISAVLNTVGALVLVFDPAGRIVNANHAFQQTTGYALDEINGRLVRDIFVIPEELAAFDSIVDRARGGVQPGEYTSHWLTRSGTRRLISWSGTLLTEGNAPATHIIVTGIDVTEQHRQEQRFRGLLESAPDAMVIVDEAGRIVFINSQTEKMFGYRRDELLGALGEVLLPERVREQHSHHRTQFFADSQVRSMGVGLELYGRRKDGVEFPVEISLGPIETGEGRFICSAIRDITGRKRADQAILDSLHEKEVLLKEVHHRVKNNLAVISSLFYLQSTYCDDDRTIAILRESQDRVRSMSLVHETLYQSGRLEAVDFAEYGVTLARDLMATYRLPGSEIQLKTDVETVRMNIDQAVPCGLILNELLSNGLKHAFRGISRGEITLRVRRTDSGCVLSVSDNGVGLPPDVSVDNTRSLGLRLVRSLARQIDGEFSLLRGPNGTEARVSLPCRTNGSV